MLNAGFTKRAASNISVQRSHPGSAFVLFPGRGSRPPGGYLTCFFIYPSYLQSLFFFLRWLKNVWLSENGSKSNIRFQGGQDALERKHVFVFVNEVNGRDLSLGNVPPKHS